MIKPETIFNNVQVGCLYVVEQKMRYVEPHLQMLGYVMEKHKFSEDCYVFRLVQNMSYGVVAGWYYLVPEAHPEPIIRIANFKEMTE